MQPAVIFNEKPATEIKKLSNIIYAVNEEVKTLNCKKIQKEDVTTNQNVSLTICGDQLDQHINGFFEKIKLQDVTKTN